MTSGNDCFACRSNPFGPEGGATLTEALSRHKGLTFVDLRCQAQQAVGQRMSIYILCDEVFETVICKRVELFHYNYLMMYNPYTLHVHAFSTRSSIPRTSL